MEKELFEQTKQLVEGLMGSQSSSAQTLQAVNSWWNVAMESPAEEELEAATKELLDQLDENHRTIEEVIAYYRKYAQLYPDDEQIAQALAAEIQRKENGEKWCDCDACTLTHTLLALHGRE